MRISLSKKNHKLGHHAMLTADRAEVFDARAVINEEILRDEFEPHVESNSDGSSTWRFNIRFLELLVLAFPSGIVGGFLKLVTRRKASS